MPFTSLDSVTITGTDSTQVLTTQEDLNNYGLVLTIDNTDTTKAIFTIYSENESLVDSTVVFNLNH